MPIPTYGQLISPLLQFLASHPDGVAVGDAYEGVADMVGITADERAVLLPSGIQPVYKNRIGWAHDALKRNGWSTSPSYGRWKITDKGLAVAAAHPTGLSDQEARDAAKRNLTLKLGKASSPDQAVPVLAAGGSLEAATPEDRIRSGMAELRASLATSLLDRLKNVAPTRFELIVNELLRQMGYGGEQGKVEHVGGAGDEGIDGIIHLDKLGLQRVYVQAKRYKDKVRSNIVQGFVGALTVKGAMSGVLMTTAEITPDARKLAEKSHVKVVLVDGPQFVDLMIDHGLGFVGPGALLVASEKLVLPTIDENLFKSEEG